MYELTPSALSQAMPMAMVRARDWAPLFQQAFERFQIDTPARMAFHLANVAVETAGCALLVEIWGPTPEQRRYDGKNGNTQPGQGKRYRGRGTIMDTGLAAYEWIKSCLHIDVVAHPELLEAPRTAALAGAASWSLRLGLNKYADAGGEGSFFACCGVLNAGNPKFHANAYDRRVEALRRFQRVLT